jgi:hypothetical protein
VLILVIPSIILWSIALFITSYPLVYGVSFSELMEPLMLPLNFIIPNKQAKDLAVTTLDCELKSSLLSCQ